MYANTINIHFFLNELSMTLVTKGHLYAYTSFLETNLIETLQKYLNYEFMKFKIL